MQITVKALNQMSRVIQALELGEDYVITMHDRQGENLTFVIGQTGVFMYNYTTERWELQSNERRY